MIETWQWEVELVKLGNTYQYGVEAINPDDGYLTMRNKGCKTWQWGVKVFKNQCNL